MVSIKRRAIKNSFSLFLILLIVAKIQIGVINVASKIKDKEIPSIPTL